MSSPVTLRAVVLLLFLASVWAGTFTLIKVAVETMPPFTIAAGRVVLAMVILVVLVQIRRERWPATLRAWGLFALIGLVGNTLPFVLFSWGEIYVDSGLTAILMGSVPLFTMLLAHGFVADERLTLGRVAGILMGLVGLVLLVGMDALGGAGSNVLAQLAILAAAFGYAVSNILVRRLRGHSATVITAGVLITATLWSLPLSAAVDAPWHLAPSAEAMWAVAALGVFGTGLSLILYFYLVTTVGATFASLTNYIIPVLGVAWGMVFLAEELTTRLAIALALIVGGVAITNLELSRAGRVPAERDRAEPG